MYIINIILPFGNNELFYLYLSFNKIEKIKLILIENMS